MCLGRSIREVKFLLSSFCTNILQIKLEKFLQLRRIFDIRDLLFHSFCPVANINPKIQMQLTRPADSDRQEPLVRIRIGAQSYDGPIGREEICRPWIMPRRSLSDPRVFSYHKLSYQWQPQKRSRLELMVYVLGFRFCILQLKSRYKSFIFHRFVL